MSQPTVEIHLSAPERRRLLPGLEHLVNGLGSFIYLGSTAHANPFERIDPQLSAVHEDRQFDLEFSEWVFYVRNQIKLPPQSCKFQFTAVELSILALAARVTRRLRKTSSRVSRPLQDKLETFRKRAKRAAIAELGEQEYKETTLKWRHFLSWMRFYLLCFRMPLPPGTVKMIWRDQRSQLEALIKNAISEMSDAQVPDSTICGLAGLLKAELRRGYRHPVILTEMLRGDPASLPVLRNFLLKRLDLDPLKPKSEPYYMRLADPLKPAPMLAIDSEGQQHKDEAKSIPESVVTAGPVSAAKPVRHKDPTSLTDAEAVRCLVPWWEAVPSAYRADVWEDAQWQLTRFLPRFVMPTTAVTSEELFQQTRPSDTAEIAPEVINLYVKWLLGWCLALTSDGRRVFRLISQSYLAQQEHLS